MMLEFGDRRDFDDPRLEWRRLFSELLGTFMLVLVAAGGGILHGKGQISLSSAVVAPGLMYANWQALLMETVLTAVLVSVILGTASAAQNVGAIAALGVGGYIALAGPLAGALIAVGCALVLRGRGGDAISYAAGSGVLDEGRLAAKQQLSQAIDRGDVVPPGIDDAEAPRSEP